MTWERGISIARLQQTLQRAFPGAAYDAWKTREPDDFLPQCDWCFQEFEPEFADDELCATCQAKADDELAAEVVDGEIESLNNTKKRGD